MIDTSSDSMENGLERGGIRMKERSSEALPFPPYPVSNCIQTNSSLQSGTFSLSLKEIPLPFFARLLYQSPHRSHHPSFSPCVESLSTYTSMNFLQHKYHDICPHLKTSRTQVNITLPLFSAYIESSGD